jgi:pimeloyl-ACP methyl ester carboxylesterase
VDDRETVVTLLTVDGERLRALHRPADGDAMGVAVVVAHGFGGGLHRPALRGVVTALSRRVGVVAIEMRGHGRSGGRSTLGEREVNDVDAGVAAARDLGYARVVTLGFSLGGAAVLRHAGLPHPHPPDAVAAVSTGSRWFQRDTAAMRRLHWLVERRSGRIVARAWPGVRVSGAGWREVPASPVEVIGAIAPLPLLLVHGDRDSYFGIAHAYALRDAAGEPVELWVVPGFGHAEAAMTPELADRLGRWALALPGVAGG